MLTPDEEHEAARADHEYDEARDRELGRQLETRDALVGITVRVIAVTPIAAVPGAYDVDTVVRFADWRKVHGGATLETAPVGGALTCGAGALDPDTAPRCGFASEASLSVRSRVSAGGEARVRERGAAVGGR